MIKKSISVYSGRRQINIGKNELVNESDVILYTLTEHKNLTSRIDSLNDEVNALKQQLDSKSNKINDLESDLNKGIEDAVSEYQNTIKENQNLIHKQNELIKEYQDMESKHIDEVTGLNKKINSLTIELSDMISLNKELIIRYNGIRDSVSTLSRIDVLLNRQKDILNRYPKLSESVDALAIDTTVKKKNDYDH